MTRIRTATGPDPPGSSRRHFKRRKTPVPRVLLSITLAGPAPSGSTGHVPALSGPLSPSPASPGSGCPQLQPCCCDSGLVQAFHLHSNQQRLTAQTESEPEPVLMDIARPHLAEDPAFRDHRPTGGRLHRSGRPPSITCHTPPGRQHSALPTPRGAIVRGRRPLPAAGRPGAATAHTRRRHFHQHVRRLPRRDAGGTTRHAVVTITRVR